MRKIIILVFSLSIILSSCQINEKVIGVWVRTGDSFAGMKVEVKKIGDVTNGTIIYCPNSMKRSGFINGDIKWKGILQIEGNNYEYTDLMKKVNQYGTILDVSYDIARMVITKDMIKIRMYTKGTESMGTEQIWLREK